MVNIYRKSQTPEKQIYAYEKLHRALEAYRNTVVVDFDEKSAEVFKQLKAKKFALATLI